jgi:hypothetical protein
MKSGMPHSRPPLPAELRCTLPELRYTLTKEFLKSMHTNKAVMMWLTALLFTIITHYPLLIAGVAFGDRITIMELFVIWRGT